MPGSLYNKRRLEHELKNTSDITNFVKALDCVPYSHLLMKLAVSIVDPHVVNWILLFSTSRTWFIFVSSPISYQFLVTYSVLQGSILGPLVLLIYLNDPPIFTLSSSVRLLPDDGVVYKKIKLMTRSSSNKT